MSWFYYSIWLSSFYMFATPICIIVVLNRFEESFLQYSSDLCWATFSNRILVSEAIQISFWTIFAKNRYNIRLRKSALLVQSVGEMRQWTRGAWTVSAVEVTYGGQMTRHHITSNLHIAKWKRRLSLYSIHKVLLRLNINYYLMWIFLVFI